MEAAAMPDRVQPAPSESGYDLYILSMHEKPGWQTRRPGDRIHAPHPGSAISYDDKIYELMAVDDAPDSLYSRRYLLKAWEECFNIRHIIPYSVEVARVTQRKIEERQVRNQQHGWAIWWMA